MITVHKQEDVDRRPPVAVSLGCHVSNIAQPHPCQADVRTAIAGVQKRFATEPPSPDMEKMLRFKNFVQKWVAQNLVPLPPDSDTSLEHWLESCNYTLSRKEELKRKWQRVVDIEDPTKNYLLCKSFVKDETYAEFKHARLINSRSDEFKAFVGPIFRLIEKEVFKNEAFIKKIPISERPKYIRDLLCVEGSRYFAADYTAFESLFTSVLMEHCEFVLYDYMTQHLPQRDQWLRVVRQALTGRNKCQFKKFRVELDATRMSGEMNTSLGNGFTNLMVLLFLAHENGCTDVKCVVEGDDSAARMTGRLPDKEDFATLGLNCKAEFHNSIETMSFCGLVFDATDLVNVTNPLEVLATFGWTSRRYLRSKKSVHKALLRCKSLSLAHQYPGCPIISSLAQYGLRATRSIDIRHFASQRGGFSLWERDQLLAALKDEKNIRIIVPPTNTRCLVEDLYGVSASVQKRIEAQLDSMDSLEEIPLPYVQFPEQWEEYFRSYSVARHKFSDYPQLYVGHEDSLCNNVNYLPSNREILSGVTLR